MLYFQIPFYMPDKATSLANTHDNNISVRTKPYLQNPVGNGITVMWETTVPSYCWVEYGTDTTRLERARMIVDGQVVCNNKLHKIRIDGLVRNILSAFSAVRNSTSMGRWSEAIGSLTTLADMTANPVAFCFDAAI